MALAIEFPPHYLDTLDEVLVAESVTAPFVATGVEFISGRTVKKPKLTITDGLKDYDGFQTLNSGSLEYETRDLEFDKQLAYEVDALDTMDNALDNAASWLAEAIRVKANPEIDQTFFSKVFDNVLAANKSSVALTPANIKDEIAKARKALGSKGISNAALYLSFDALYALEKATERQYSNDTVITDTIGNYNGFPLYVVPDEILGSIDFLAVAPGTVELIKKRAVTYLFAPGDHPNGDKWLAQYRLVYDTIVYDNKKPGLYTNYTPAPPAPAPEP
jgi:hypothetical protein